MLQFAPCEVLTKRSPEPVRAFVHKHDYDSNTFLCRVIFGLESRADGTIKIYTVSKRKIDLKLDHEPKKRLYLYVLLCVVIVMLIFVIFYSHIC